MTAPTPAAVRGAMNYADMRPQSQSEKEALEGEMRTADEILTDHIRAIAEEMREIAASRECYDEGATAKELRFFADKLEGKQ